VETFTLSAPQIDRFASGIVKAIVTGNIASTFVENPRLMEAMIAVGVPTISRKQLATANRWIPKLAEEATVAGKVLVAAKVALLVDSAQHDSMPTSRIAAAYRPDQAVATPGVASGRRSVRDTQIQVGPVFSAAARIAPTVVLTQGPSKFQRALPLGCGIATCTTESWCHKPAPSWSSKPSCMRFFHQTQVAWPSAQL
jgi:hypothetical protein